MNIAISGGLCIITLYIWKVQANVERKLKSHELTAPFATKEFIWFAVCFLWSCNLKTKHDS